jgi:hypothetical protein
LDAFDLGELFGESHGFFEIQGMSNDMSAPSGDLTQRPKTPESLMVSVDTFNRVVNEIQQSQHVIQHENMMLKAALAKLLTSINKDKDRLHELCRHLHGLCRENSKDIAQVGRYTAYLDRMAGSRFHGVDNTMHQIVQAMKQYVPESSSSLPNVQREADRLLYTTITTKIFYQDGGGANVLTGGQILEFFSLLIKSGSIVGGGEGAFLKVYGDLRGPFHVYLCGKGVDASTGQAKDILVDFLRESAVALRTVLHAHHPVLRFKDRHNGCTNVILGWKWVVVNAHTNSAVTM